MFHLWKTQSSPLNNKTTKGKTMQTRNRKGGAKLGVLFFILLIASVVLNVILLNGCEFLGIEGRSGQGRPVQPPPASSSESSYLRELAEVLKLNEGPEKTPGDIAFDIQQCLNNRQKYRGEVLSSDSFEKASAAIRISKDQETFKAYHDFISKIAGKTIIVLE